MNLELNIDIEFDFEDIDKAVEAYVEDWGYDTSGVEKFYLDYFLDNLYGPLPDSLREKMKEAFPEKNKYPLLRSFASRLHLHFSRALDKIVMKSGGKQYPSR